MQCHKCNSGEFIKGLPVIHSVPPDHPTTTPMQASVPFPAALAASYHSRIPVSDVRGEGRVVGGFARRESVSDDTGGNWNGLCSAEGFVEDSPRASQTGFDCEQGQARYQAVCEHGICLRRLEDPAAHREFSCQPGPTYTNYANTTQRQTAVDRLAPPAKPKVKMPLGTGPWNKRHTNMPPRPPAALAILLVTQQP